MAICLSCPNRARHSCSRDCAIVLLLALLTGCESRTKPHTTTPLDHRNVVLITLDTTRADHLSCYAGDKASMAKRHAQTPHLDTLAREGVRFVHTTVQVPLTLPSHASIFTGVYSDVHGLRDMGGFVLDERLPTLAEIARHAGLLTAAFVGSKAVARHFGLARGFDLYDDRIAARSEEGLPGTYPRRSATETTDAALNWLHGHSQDRFFLWVHYYDPHEPYDPPRAYKNRFSGDPYSGAIAYVDEQVGRLVASLNPELRRRTLVIVIGDHGEGLYDHGEGTHGVFLYEDTLRVPFIMTGPDIPAQITIVPQVRSIDVLPTVADFLGQPSPGSLQGVSLWPLIKRGHPRPGQGFNYAYLETLYPRTYMGWSELRGMRTDRWKFVLAPRPELYDLESDPGEKENVIARYPAEADELQKKIWELIGAPAKDQQLAYQPLSAEKREELASLGYVNAGASRKIILNGSGPDPKDHVGSLLALREYGRLIGAGAYGQAARVMERALRDDESNPLLRVYLAKSYEVLHDWRRVILAYQGAIDAGHGTDMILSRLGEAYLHVNDLDHAIPAMEEASRINPADLDNLFNLGNAYLETQRYADAERTLKGLLMLDSRYSAAYNVLGLVSVQRGQIDSARQNFERALEINPDDPEPMMNLGVLYQKTGDKVLAVRYLTLFLEKAPREQYRDLLPEVRQTLRDLQR
jgi:choline-sulfatase